MISELGRFLSTMISVLLGIGAEVLSRGLLYAGTQSMRVSRRVGAAITRAGHVCGNFADDMLEETMDID